ncbi:glycoside hydrolase family 38 protein [Hydnum rufescens UP504]|uniref:Alpha-mannosidase n=1 Tax=Hydnum rufescens UP504 TaxID=1448309 RepID=A0A9P6B2E2_9AGAM|nr:glycoside hydrolase family 38 protein [Hydnum rufescens UP504]
MAHEHSHHRQFSKAYTPFGNKGDSNSNNGGDDERPANPRAYPTLNFGPGNKWVKNLTRDRLNTFQGGRYSDINLSSTLYTQRTDSSEYIKLKVWSAPDRTKPSFHEAMKQTFREAKKHESFGPSLSLTIPAHWNKYERVQFEFDPGCEAMVYTTSGTPLQGITGGWGGERRVEYIIKPEQRAQGTFELVIESSCNGLFGVPWGDTINPPDWNRYFNLDSADLVVPNMEAWRLMWDFNTLRQLSDALPGNTPLQNQALTVATDILNVFRYDDPSTIAKSRKLAEQVLGEGWEKKADGVYNEGTGKIHLWGIGHCHIDTAWLWPYSVTQQKVARSWATQVDLMDRYPEHRFTASSAQQWKWLEQLYPPLFERVKAKVLSGQFHPVGGSWVENDANMPSGEALARQLIYGQRFFQTRFGIRCNTAWLPDSFGVSGALPQIIREAGMERFFTQKLSWNNINVFPHTTFNWVGIDGTQVLCHMTPVDTYNAQANVDDIRRGMNNNKNIESSDTALLVFGNGDGGGGPLAQMLESLRRIRAAGNQTRDIPLVGMGTSVDDFFDDVEKNSDEGRKLPNWHGELYLEFHRGTYTSHGIIKKGNRKSEILLREVELLTTLASLQKGSYVYPKGKIDDMWENLLLNQFHDVLPGSAIGMVYEDAERIYKDIAKQSDKLIKEAISVLLPSSFMLPLEDTTLTSKIPRGRIITLNTVHAPRREIVPISLAGPANLTRWLKDEVVQISKDGQTGYIMVDTPGGSVAPVTGLFADSAGAHAFETKTGDFILKNSNIELKITNGRIVSLYDVQLERELIPENTTGGLVVFDDKPGYWDAWDVEWYHLQTAQPLQFESIKIVENGPAYASLESTVTLGASVIKVKISITSSTATRRESSRSTIRFDAEVDWRQRHNFLKFEIPLNINNPEAIFDAAFGHVSRPTHRNTSQDLAKFEVCGHKYADLSEYGYGVAILSESKYGFAAEGNVIRISLLRSATAPDPEQDQGYNSFSWALLPHASHFYDSDVPIAAHFFNSPVHVLYAPQAVPTGPLAAAEHHGLFNVENAPNVILETVKRGDDDDHSKKTKQSSIVLRLYEAYGGHAHAKLHISAKLGVSKATLTNLLEDEGKSLELHSVPAADGTAEAEDTILDLKFRAFQFITVKLIVQGKPDVSQLEGWINVLKI